MAKTLFSMDETTVVVTGAGRGLGRAIALGLAGQGANVVLGGRTQEKLDAVAAEAAERGGSVLPLSFDANKEASVEAMVSRAAEWKGGLDGMVVNHGVALHTKAEDTTNEEFRSVVETNLISCFVCARTAGRQFLRQGSPGSIVLISSNGSMVAFDGLVAYGASKGGVDQLNRQLASEWASRDIRVNVVAPGYMNSFMQGTEGKYGDAAFRDQIASKIPMSRWGEPKELVGAVTYFLSGASSYTTGQYLAVDGGYAIV